MTIITANGTRLNYRLEGREGAPVIAFSNSLGTTLAMWDAQVAALSDRFRCLRYDTRGHGGSDLPIVHFTVDDLAADMAALLDGLGIRRAHIVGLSLGGMTGQALAVIRPDLVERLILVATAAFLPPRDLWLDRAALVREKGMAAVADNVVQRWFTPPNQAARGAMATRQRLLNEVSAEGYAACCEAIGAMDLRARIGAIRAPTLVVSGADDPATPPTMGEEIRDYIQGAVFKILPSAAHMIAIERPVELNGLIASFLDESPTAAPKAGPASQEMPAAYETGLSNRRDMLGSEHVDRALSQAGGFAAPWEDFITRYDWGEIWGDDTLPWKTRSIVTLAIMVALGREEEFKLHIRPALRNGVTPEEMRALLKQCAVYAGVPAANAAFRWIRDALGEELG